MAQEGDIAGLFRAGRLDDAIAVATAQVRARAGDVGVRLVLAELLLFQNQLDRIDTLLNAAMTIDPSWAVRVAEFRQLLRGEVARRQLTSEGRVPDFLGEPTASQRASLAASVAVQAGDLAAAAAACAEAEAIRPRTSGRMGETTFDDIRDGDDILCGTLEVLTTTGKYFWIPFERVVSLTPHAPGTPRDLFWRRATLVVADGPTGEVYLPVSYEPAASAPPELQLGRVTDWTEIGDGIVRGLGQKTLLVGDEGVPLLQLGVLETA